MRNVFPMGPRTSPNDSGLRGDGQPNPDPFTARAAAPKRQSGTHEAHLQKFQQQCGLTGMERGMPQAMPRNHMVEDLAVKTPGKHAPDNYET